MSSITRAMFQGAGGAASTAEFMWSFGSGTTGDTTTLQGVQVDSSDNIIVAGTTLEDGAGNLDIFVAKVSSSGDLVWKNTYGTSNSEVLDYGNVLAVDTSDDSIYVSHQNSFGALAIIKINSDGTINKVVRWNNYDVNTVRIWVDSSYVYVSGSEVGNSFGSGTPARVGLAFKIDKSDLTTVDFFRYYYKDYLTNGSGTGCYGDSSGNIYATGLTSTGGASNEGTVIKFNSGGSTLAQKRYGSPSGDSFFSGDNDGTYLYVAGVKATQPCLLKIRNSDLTVEDSLLCTDGNISVVCNWNSSLDQGMWPLEVGTSGGDGIQFIKLDSNLDELNSIRFQNSAVTDGTRFNGTLDSEGNMIGVFIGRNSGDNVTRGYLFKVGPNFQGSGTILGVTYDQPSRSYSAGITTNTHSDSQSTVSVTISTDTGYSGATAVIGTNTSDF